MSLVPNSYIHVNHMTPPVWNEMTYHERKEWRNLWARRGIRYYECDICIFPIYKGEPCEHCLHKAAGRLARRALVKQLKENKRVVRTVCEFIEQYDRKDTKMVTLSKRKLDCLVLAAAAGLETIQQFQLEDDNRASAKTP